MLYTNTTKIPGRNSSMFTTAHSYECSVYSNDYFSVLGFGSQCASADMASSETFDIHRILLQNNIWLLENVGDMSDIPPGGQGNLIVICNDLI